MNATAPTPTPDAPPPAPLLPAFFLQPRAVLWLWALPAALLLLLNFQAYELIEGNMDATQRSHAHLLGCAGLANLLGALGFYLFSRLRPQLAEANLASHLWRGLAPLLAQTAYLWLALSWAGDVLPASVTTWIYPEERFIFNQLTFAMLPLFLGILRIACGRPAANTGAAIAINLALGVGAPLALYLFGTALSVIAARIPFSGTILAIAFVTFGIVLFIGVVRTTMLVLRRTESWGTTGERVAIAVFALVLPICGLLLNRDIPFPVDFQAWEVYALTVANAAILFLASYQHARRPRLSFLLLAATFPFSLYFFFVFLPYTPLSILAIIAFGVGFIVLAPIFLFVLHLSLLNKSSHAVHGGAGRWRLWLAGVGCALLLPGFFVVRSLADRASLHAALDYVYAPTIDATERRYPGNRLNLRRALASHRSYKNGIYYPLLSDFYAWLVFDNLVLPDPKLATLETTFFGAVGLDKNRDPFRQRADFWGRRSVRDRHRAPRAADMPHTVEVSRLEVRTTTVDAAATTATFVLTLAHNGTDTFRAAEYVQKLRLPAGVSVNGFRLHIDGTPVPGRFVEKKTALWVYNMIRDTERRDPGLLVYTAPNELELRVFPINRNQPVIVEIDLLVPAALSVRDLGEPTTVPNVVLGAIDALLRPQLARTERGTVVVGLESLQLPGVEREPYVHLIVDRSAANAFTGDLAAAVRALRAKYPAIRRARVTVANFDVADLVPNLTPLDQLPPLVTVDWERQLPAAGSLSLDLALARALRQHRDTDLDGATKDLPPRPVFVILSQRATARTLTLPLTDTWADFNPQFELVELGADGSFVAHRENTFDPPPLVRCGRSVRPVNADHAVHFATTAAGREPLEFYDAASSTWSALPPIPANTAASWLAAVDLQLQSAAHARSPGAPADDLPALVAASRARGILIPDTSYIVVENNAQWKMLEKGEQQKLGQNAALEFVESPAPPALWVALGFAAWLGFRRWRRGAVA